MEDDYDADCDEDDSSPWYADEDDDEDDWPEYGGPDLSSSADGLLLRVSRRRKWHARRATKAARHVRLAVAWDERERVSVLRRFRSRRLYPQPLSEDSVANRKPGRWWYGEGEIPF